MASIDDDGAADIEIRMDVEGDGVPIVILVGELDTSNAAAVGAAVESITAQRRARLIFDLSELQFMDSAGIAVLIGAASKVDAVCLRNPTPIVRRVVELTGLTTILPIEP